MITRTIAWTAGITAVMAGSAFGQVWGSGSGGREGSQARAASPVIQDESYPVIALLSRRVEVVDWEDITFEEILDWMRDQGNRQVNVVPRWSSLNTVGVDQESTIARLVLRNSTVAEIMAEVLNELGAASGANITFQGERNTIRIATQVDFDNYRVLRVYDVTDVLFRVPDFSESAPQVDLARQSNAGGGGGGGGQPIFANAGGQNQQELSEEGDQDPEQILQDMIDTIRAVVDPLNWDQGQGTAPGGGPNRIRGYGRRSLLVYAPISVHEQINGFFAIDR